MTSSLSELIDGVRPERPSTEPAPGWTGPRVNLLPPEVVGRRAVRRAQRGTAVAAAVVAVGLTAAWAVGAARTGAAQEEVDAVLARTSALQAEQAEQAEYAAAPQTIARLEAARAARSGAMAQDVRWYSYTDALTRALPAGAWVEGVQTALAGTAAATDTAAAGTSTGVGTVTISAKSTSYDDVAGYLDALAAVPGVADAYLTTSTRDDSTGVGVVSFTVTAQVTADALSHRFDQSTDTEAG